MKKRTFSLSEAVIRKLDVLNDCYGIDKATFIRMSIYHGLEKMNSKTHPFYPYRNHELKKLDKIKYNITLPEETWERFAKTVKAIKYNLEEHIPDGELIELFIRLEIKKHVLFTDSFLKDDDVDDLELFELGNSIEVTTTIPNIFFRKLQDEMKATGLKQSKIGRYLMANALLQEYMQSSFETVDSDADLLKHIEACGINRYKGVILLRNLINANKIVLLSDNDMTY